MKTRLLTAALGCALALATAACGDGGDARTLNGRWAGDIPEDSLTFYSDGTVAGGATWPCRGKAKPQGDGYRMDLDCGGLGQIVMTATRGDGNELRVTDNDGQVHILHKAS